MNELTDMHFCIQCIDQTSNKTGDFVYLAREPFMAISPVFDNLPDLFTWMKERGLTTGILCDFAVYRVK